MSSPTVGLVGCGRWGAHVLRDLRLAGAEVVVVARSSSSRARAETGGARGVVPAVAELGAVDGIVVETATSTHAAVAEEALDHGVPVFVEKPLATTVDAAARLVRRAPDRLFSLDLWRHHPGVEALAAAARRGDHGGPVGLRVVHWRHGIAHTDVDACWVLLPHALAAGLEVLGAPGPVRAAWAHRERSAVVGLVGRLGDDPWLHVDVTARAPEACHLLALHCRDATLTLPDPYADHLVVHRHAGRPASGPARAPGRVPIATDPPLLRELRDVVAHLAGGPPPPRAAAEDGLAIVRAISDLRDRAAGRAG